MKSNLDKEINNQYNKLIHIIIPKICSHKNVDKEKYEKKLFYEIYFIWYMSNRGELSHFLNHDYYNYTCSFMYESYISLILNQLTAASLLLRSSIENFIKFLLISKNLEPNNTRFKENTRKLKNEIRNDTVNSEIDKLVTIYSDLSSISHSANENKINIIKYLSSTIKSSKKLKKDTISHFKKTVRIYDYFLLKICKLSLSRWDTNDLNNVLHIVFKDKQSKNIINNLKNKNISCHD